MKSKKFVIGLLLYAVMVLQFPVMTKADSMGEKISVEYFEDGTYVETYIEQLLVAARTKTKTGKKTKVGKSANGEKLWSVTVTGTFSYGNGTSKCTNAQVSTETYDSQWKKYSSSASKSGSTAKADAVFKKYSNAIMKDTVSASVSLKCNSTGQLS